MYYNLFNLALFCFCRPNEMNETKRRKEIVRRLSFVLPSFTADWDTVLNVARDKNQQPYFCVIFRLSASVYFYPSETPCTYLALMTKCNIFFFLSLSVCVPHRHHHHCSFHREWNHCSQSWGKYAKVLAFVKRFALILGVVSELILLLFIGVFHLIPLWFLFFQLFTERKRKKKTKTRKKSVSSVVQDNLLIRLRERCHFP